MNDMIINAAQDPSCILAVTPDRGGSWWAALRPGGNYPWPSSTPRNFADEPTAFYDCQSICSEKIDPSHDYRFLFDSEIVSDKIECSMFYADAAGFPFGIYCHPTNQINCFTNLFRVSSSPSSQYTNTSVYNGESRLQGRHVIEMEIAGNSLKTYLDGVLINRPSGFVRTGVATCDLPQCNSGYVYKIQIEDLTTGRTVWSYPSEAERVRLLTKTNVRTDRGVFEAADNEQKAYVQTALELPNTSHTIIWRGSFTQPPDDATITRDTQTCYSCGSVGSGNNWLALRPRRLEAFLKLSNFASMIVVAEYAELSDRANTVAVVLDKEQAKFSAYLNGAHKGTLSNIGTSDVVSSWPVSLGRHYKMAQTDFLLVFDRALSAAEIAALCPTAN